MDTRGIVHPKLVQSRVCDDDAPVGKDDGVAHLVQEICLVTEYLADRYRRLAPDPPRQPRVIGWTGILDDPDAGAVPGHLRRGVGMATRWPGGGHHSERQRGDSPWSDCFLLAGHLPSSSVSSIG